MIDQVTPTQLAAWFAADPAAAPVLLDVREPWEWETASVLPAGFKLVTIPMNEIPGRLAELDPSQRVAMFLAQNGFDALANVSGGINAWSIQHDPAVPRY